jgi:hypothetical protein
MMAPGFVVTKRIYLSLHYGYPTIMIGTGTPAGFSSM